MNQKSSSETTEAKGIQSVERAVALLMELSTVSRDTDLAELARRTGLTKSTASRLLSTMQKRGLVRQDPATRRFSLGSELIRLGNVAIGQLWRPEVFHSYLERLALQTGETASLAVREGERAVYIDQVSSQNIIRSFPPVGAKVALHCTAVGKILLEGMPRSKAEQVLKRTGLPAYTANTITDHTAILAEIGRIDEAGYAVDDEETELGGRCLAAPIRSHSGEIVAALGVSGPTQRVTHERLADLSRELKAIATEISAQLGYSQK